MQITYPGGGATNNNFTSIPAVNVPAWLYTDSFTIRGWVRRGSGASTSFRCVANAQNLFMVSCSTGVFRLNVYDNDETAAASATITIANGDWIYFAASFDVSTGAMVVVARTQNTAGGGVSDRAAGTGTFTGTGTRTAGILYWGRNKTTSDGGGSGTANAWDGEIGMLVISTGATTQANLETMVDAAFVDLAGQTGKKSPVLPLTYAGTGFSGVLATKWVALNAAMVQEPTGGSTGARAGVTLTDTNYVWWAFDDATPTNADVEAILDTYNTFDVVGTLTFADDDSAFFGLVPPGTTTNGNNAVPSTTLVEFRDNTPRSGGGVRRGICEANSRGVRVEWYAGGPAVYGVWAGNFAHGLVASRYAKIGGMCNVAILGGSIRRPIFDMPISPSSSGTFNPITSGTYSDFSRLWTNTGATGSNGPGTGTRFATAAATITQRMTFDAGTLIDGSTAVVHDAILLEYPGSPDTFDWAIEDAPDVGAAGTPVASGSESGMNTTAVTYTYTTATDSYSAGTPSITVALPSGDQTTIANLLASGELVGLYVSAGTGTGSLAQILAITPGATAVLTLKHALNTSIGDGATVRFGRVGYRRIRNTAPIGTDACQGYRITANAGLIWFCVGAVATGVDGWAPGTFGWGGNGFTTQISQAWTGMYTKMVTALDLDWAFLFVAGQGSSTNADRMTFAGLLGLPASDCILAGDPVHRIVDNQTDQFNDDALAQTTYPAVVSTESCGSVIAAYGFSGKQNLTHPSMEQYKLVWDTLWVEAAGIQPNQTGGGGRTSRTIGGRAGRSCR